MKTDPRHSVVLDLESSKSEPRRNSRNELNEKNVDRSETAFLSFQPIFCVDVMSQPSFYWFSTETERVFGAVRGAEAQERVKVRGEVVWTSELRNCGSREWGNDIGSDFALALSIHTHTVRFCCCLFLPVYANRVRNAPCERTTASL
jgi:hypothetical protein